VTMKIPPCLLINMPSLRFGFSSWKAASRGRGPAEKIVKVRTFVKDFAITYA
jgi:hypothetical protein